MRAEGAEEAVPTGCTGTAPTSAAEGCRRRRTSGPRECKSVEEGEGAEVWWRSSEWAARWVWLPGRGAGEGGMKAEVAGGGMECGPGRPAGEEAGAELPQAWGEEGAEPRGEQVEEGAGPRGEQAGEGAGLRGEQVGEGAELRGEQMGEGAEPRGEQAEEGAGQRGEQVEEGAELRGEQAEVRSQGAVSVSAGGVDCRGLGRVGPRMRAPEVGDGRDPSWLHQRLG